MSNLSEEEKKAIDILENVIADEVICTYCTEFAVPKYNCNLCVDKNGNPDDCYYEKAIDIVLNLIEKQQVEINKEKEKNKNLQDKCIELEEENIKIKHLMRNPCDIPRQIIIEKMNKDMNTNEHTILGGRKYGKTLEYGIRLGRIQMCEELLQEGDDK